MIFPLAELDAPIQLVLADIYPDGTVWFALTDPKNRRAHVCIDGREASSTRHRLFDRVRHPKKPGAVLIDLGAIEEGIVVPLVSRWLDSGTPKALGLHEYGWEIFRDALIHIGTCT